MNVCLSTSVSLAQVKILKFRDRKISKFPSKNFLAERKIDEKHLRKEIKIVIQNIRGVRTGLFTPDMAFERIVKEQVEQLSTAPSNVVDQVTTEVIGAVRDCSKVGDS